MTSLIKKALASMESMDVSVQVSKQASASTIESTPVQTSSDSVNDAKDVTVVMDGPLSSVYHKALNIAFAKPDPVTGVPAVESLALADYYKAIELKEKTATEGNSTSVDSAINISATGTVLRAPVEQEAIPVVKELQSSGAPGDFIIVYNSMDPTDDSPMGVSNGVTAVEMDKQVKISTEDIESFSIVIKLKSKT